MEIQDKGDNHLFIIQNCYEAFLAAVTNAKEEGFEAFIIDNNKSVELDAYKWPKIFPTIIVKKVYR